MMDGVLLGSSQGFSPGDRATFIWPCHFKKQKPRSQQQRAGLLKADLAEILGRPVITPANGLLGQAVEDLNEGDVG